MNYSETKLSVVACSLITNDCIKFKVTSLSMEKNMIRAECRLIHFGYDLRKAVTFYIVKRTVDWDSCLFAPSICGRNGTLSENSMAYTLHYSIWQTMDLITIKTPNAKCRLCWCLIEFIGWRYSQSCWYFRLDLWTVAHLTFSLFSSPPPLPCVKYCILCLYTMLSGRGIWGHRRVGASDK
jgi:hypothetical protein